MTNYEALLVAYEVDVQFCEVSGMEHLQMLMTRSEIARGEDQLLKEQRARLEQADRKLLQQASRFYQGIQRIADLAAWRRDENVPPEHWWWYLDVLAQLPDMPAPASPREAIAA